MDGELELGKEHPLGSALAREQSGELVAQRSFPQELERVFERYAPGSLGMGEDERLDKGAERVDPRFVRPGLALAQFGRQGMDEGEELEPVKKMEEEKQREKRRGDRVIIHHVLKQKNSKNKHTQITL